jgi:hypothetical protein
MRNNTGDCTHFARVGFILLPTLRGLLTNTAGNLDQNKINDELKVAKDLRGSGRVLIDPLFRNLPGSAEYLTWF